jgi:hypothetical protein
VSPQTTRRHQTPTVRPATGQLGTDSAALRRRLDDAICDRGLKWTRDTAAAVERILADTELLDALIAHRQKDAGCMVGYLRDDGSGPWFAEWSADVCDLPAARKKLADAIAEAPVYPWRIYALTDITERPSE